MATYEVVHSLVRHDGQDYRAGDTVELDQATGDALVTAGAVAPATADKAPSRRKQAAGGTGE